jgi:hypothetical protein
VQGHDAELLEVNVDGEDEGARRFYERHGYANREPNQTQPQLYYFRELGRPVDSSARVVTACIAGATRQKRRGMGGSPHIGPPSNL